MERGLLEFKTWGKSTTFGNAETSGLGEKSFQKAKSGLRGDELRVGKRNTWTSFLGIPFMYSIRRHLSLAMCPTSEIITDMVLEFENQMEMEQISEAMSLEG